MAPLQAIYQGCLIRLLFSQLVTLYLTPVFYTYMANFQTWLGRKKRPQVVEQEEVVTLA